jgi:hypothetical protein
VAVLLFALYAVLAVGLRRGSNAARVTTWVVCGLGLLAGCGSALTVFGQDGLSDSGPGAMYPSGWVGLNVAMTIAQMIGYVTVAVLLVASPAHFFRGGGAPAQAGQAGPYGTYGALPGMPGLYSQPPAPDPYGAPGQYPPPGSAPGQYPPAGSTPGQYPPPGSAPGQYPPPGGAPGNPVVPGNPVGPAGPYGAPYGGNPYAAPRPPEPGPDDDYWARPSS